MMKTRVFGTSLLSGLIFSVVVFLIDFFVMQIEHTAWYYIFLGLTFLLISHFMILRKRKTNAQSITKNE